MSQPAPYIDVYMDEMIYEELLEQQQLNAITVQTNKPSSPLGRVATDLFGLGLLYAGTFCICDAIRAAKTGEWTNLYWMFLGPWNYLTGCPVANWLHDKFGLEVTAKDCETNYQEGCYECTWNRRGEQPLPDADINQCLKDQVDEYIDCMQSTREGFPDEGVGCKDRAVDSYYDCVRNGGDPSNCLVTYETDILNCQTEYLPESCFVNAVEEYQVCLTDGKTDCATRYYENTYNCDMQQ